MTFKTFILGFLISFAVPWVAVVVKPFAEMRALEPVYFSDDSGQPSGVYVPRRPGRIATGAAIYAAEGCYLCHTQLIRPTFAGADLGRQGWAGFRPTKENPVDTRRETTPYDYHGEDFAWVGLMRYGPDLSNVGGRVERHVAEGGLDETPAEWFYRHLYAPRAKAGADYYWSACPPQRHHFITQRVHGQGSPDALPVPSPAGTEVVPNARIRALVSYLSSLRKDDQVPAAIDYGPDEAGAPES